MYNTVFVGGTFDNLHKGHIALLTRAFGEGQKIIIGLTSDNYVHKYKKGSYSSFDDRKKLLEVFLKNSGLWQRCTVISIDDPLEPAVSSSEINAIIITEHNRQRGEEINAKRFEKNLSPFALIEVPLTVADDGLPISSTRVHNKEIDASGHLKMPEKMRPELQLPQGPILLGSDIKSSLDKNCKNIIVTVGDVTTKSFIDLGRIPNLAIIDLKVGRIPFIKLEEFNFPKDIQMQKVTSSPGIISKEAHDAIINWWKEIDVGKLKSLVLVIEGEEDLLALPAIFYAKVGSIIYYGQPPIGDSKSGLVEVVVTDQKKNEVGLLLEKFLSK